MPDETTPTPPAAPGARPPKLETLLMAAATTFATRGYAGTSMRDIAHDSGISLSGIYYYTRGKAALLYEIQARTIDALLASAAEALSGVTAPLDQLLRFIENHTAYMDEHPAFVRVLAHETAPGSADERREVVEMKRLQYVRVLRDILDRVRAEYPAPVPTEFGADMLFAMMSGPRQWGISDTALTVGAASRGVYDLFVNGFTGAGAAAR
jgi:AcrR family transcriptional regulator